MDRLKDLESALKILEHDKKVSISYLKRARLVLDNDTKLGKLHDRLERINSQMNKKLIRPEGNYSPLLIQVEKTIKDLANEPDYRTRVEQYQRRFKVVKSFYTN